MKKKQVNPRVYLVVISAIMAASAFLYVNSPSTASGAFSAVGENQSADNTRIGCTVIHWHPRMKIVIENNQERIPANVGITIGNVVDTQLSGGSFSPIHTHDKSGVLHMENNCIERKPETLSIGYFFTVWGKTFNSTCIMQHCNENRKIVSMTVNGIANSDFQAYQLRDGDEIVITYDAPVPSEKTTLAPLRGTTYRI